MTCRLEFAVYSWLRWFEDHIAVWIVVDDTVCTDTSDEQFTVTINHVVDLQQSCWQSFVERYVSVGVSIEQRPARLQLATTLPTFLAVNKVKDKGIHLSSNLMTAGNVDLYSD